MNSMKSTKSKEESIVSARERGDCLMRKITEVAKAIGLISPAIAGNLIWEDFELFWTALLFCSTFLVYAWWKREDSIKKANDTILRFLERLAWVHSTMHVVEIGTKEKRNRRHTVDVTYDDVLKHHITLSRVYQGAIDKFMEDCKKEYKIENISGYVRNELLYKNDKESKDSQIDKKETK